MSRRIKLEFYPKVRENESLFRTLSVIIIIFVLLKLLTYHLQVIGNVFPNELRESASLLTTDLLVRGGQPYALENQPEYTNVYGIFYHILVFPLAKIFGTTLPVHRVVSGLFIFLSCSIFFAALQYRNISLIFSLSATLILYAHLLYFTTPLAKPDSLGFFLFLYSLLIPWRFQYSSWSRLASVVFSILGFLTKPYFVLSIFYLTLYLFLFKSKKLGIKQGILSLTLLSITICLVNQRLETYFNDVIWINYYISGQDIIYSFKQLYAYSKINFGITLILFWGFVVRAINNPYHQIIKSKSNKIFKFNFLDAEKPLINSKVDLIEFSLIISLVVFVGKFGQHWGSWLIYIHHLISPFFITVSIEFLDKHIKKQKKKLVILILNSLLLINLLSVSSSQVLPPVSYDLKAWNHLKSLVSQHQHIFNSPIIASILTEQSKKVYDSGQSQYFVLSTKRPDFLDFIISPKVDKIKKRYQNFLQEINNDVKSKKYDLIVLTKGYSPFISEDFLKKYYQYKETLVAPMSIKVRRDWELNIWKPKVR